MSHHSTNRVTSPPSPTAASISSPPIPYRRDRSASLVNSLTPTNSTPNITSNTLADRASMNSSQPHQQQHTTTAGGGQLDDTLFTKRSHLRQTSADWNATQLAALHSQRAAAAAAASFSQHRRSPGSDDEEIIGKDVPFTMNAAINYDMPKAPNVHATLPLDFFAAAAASPSPVNLNATSPLSVSAHSPSSATLTSPIRTPRAISHHARALRSMTIEEDENDDIVEPLPHAIAATMPHAASVASRSPNRAAQQAQSQAVQAAHNEQWHLQQVPPSINYTPPSSIHSTATINTHATSALSSINTHATSKLPNSAFSSNSATINGTMISQSTSPPRSIRYDPPAVRPHTTSHASLHARRATCMMEHTAEAVGATNPHGIESISTATTVGSTSPAAISPTNSGNSQRTPPGHCRHVSSPSIAPFIGGASPSGLKLTGLLENQQMTYPYPQQLPSSQQQQQQLQHPYGSQLQQSYTQQRPATAGSDPNQLPSYSRQPSTDSPDDLDYSDDGLHSSTSYSLPPVPPTTATTKTSPYRGARLLAHLVREKVLPTLPQQNNENGHHPPRWNSQHIVKRFLTHKYGDFDVGSMLAQRFSLDEFRHRMGARLHHLDNQSTIAATTEVMVNMFSSLKTFHQLLDGTSVLNAHLSKRQALQNIISTVHTLLDADTVIVYLLQRKGDAMSMKAVTGYTTTKPSSNGANGSVNGGTRREVGETILKPAEQAIAAELVSHVARTGELRNVRSCSSEPLCAPWFAAQNQLPGSLPHLVTSMSGLSPNSMPLMLDPLSPMPPLTPSHTSSSGYYNPAPMPNISLTLNPSLGASVATPSSSSQPRSSPIAREREVLSQTTPSLSGAGGNTNIYSTMPMPSPNAHWMRTMPASSFANALSPPAPSPTAVNTPVPGSETTTPSNANLMVNVKRGSLVTSSPTASMSSPSPSPTSPGLHAHHTSAGSSLYTPPPPSTSSSTYAPFSTPQRDPSRESMSISVSREPSLSASSANSSGTSHAKAAAAAAGLFIRAPSFSVAQAMVNQPQFILKNCLCVPVRGNASSQPSNSGDLSGIASSGTTPVPAAEGQVVAVIQACNKRTGQYFTSEDVQILQFVGLLAGQSLSNASLYEEALLRRRQQEALCTMIELMSAETGVDEVIECMVTAAYRLLEIDRISFYVVDDARGQLVCKVSKDQNAIGQRLPLRYGLIGLVAAEGKLINISDCSNDSRCKDIITLDKVTGYTTRNILTLPIQDNTNRVAAVIQVINKRKGVFTSEDEILMQSLSRSAGQILRKAQLFSALLVEQRKTKALMAILQAEENEVSIESLLDRIIHTTHDVLPCQKVAIYFVDAVREDFYTLVSDATAAAAAAAASQPFSRQVSSGEVTKGNTTNTSTSTSTPRSSTNASPVTPEHGRMTPTTPHGASSSNSTIGGVLTSGASTPGAAASTAATTTAAGGSKKSSVRSGTLRPGAISALAMAPPSTTQHLSLPLRKGLAGWVAEHGVMLNLANAAADPRFDSVFDRLVNSAGSTSSNDSSAATTPTGSTVASGFTSSSSITTPTGGNNISGPFRTRSTLCVPLHNTTGTTIAVLQVINRLKKDVGASTVSPNINASMTPADIIAFSDEDEEILRALCIQAGITLRRRLTEVLLGRSRRELGDDKQISALYEIYGGGGGYQRNAPPHTSSQAAGTDAAHTDATLANIGALGVLSPRSLEKRVRKRNTTTIIEGIERSKPSTPQASPMSPGANVMGPPSLFSGLTTSTSPVVRSGSGLPPIPIPYSPSSHSSAGSTPTTTTTIVTTSAIRSPNITINTSSNTSSPALSAVPVIGSNSSSPASDIGIGAASLTHATMQLGVFIPSAVPIRAATSTVMFSSSPSTLSSSGSSTTSTADASTSTNVTPPRGGPVSLLSPLNTASSPLSSLTPSIVTSSTSTDAIQLMSSPTHRHLLQSEQHRASAATPASQGFVSNHDEMVLIHRKNAWQTQAASIKEEAEKKDGRDQADENSTSIVTIKQRQQLRYAWPLLSPSSYARLDITVLHNLDTFNVFDYSEDELVHFSLMILQDLNLIGDFGLPMGKLQRFLSAVRANYNANTYHCYFHGFHVMQFAYWMLRTTEAYQFLTKLEQLSLLLAALCHDIDHPGTTNGFQIASQSDIALAHNDTSCLEMHHAFVTFELLRDPEMNVFTDESCMIDAGSALSTAEPSPSSASVTAAAAATLNTSSTSGTSTTTAVASSPTSTPTSTEAKWSLPQFRTFRKTVISAILSTDMSKHFDLCRKLDGQLPNCEGLDSTKEEDRMFVIDLLCHCSDLSAQVLPYQYAVIWENRLTQEFIWQANMEQKLGLPISTFMQGLNDPTVRFKNHLAFYDFILNPLWLGMVELFPTLQECVKNLLENRKAFMRFIPGESISSGSATNASAHSLQRSMTPDDFTNEASDGYGDSSAATTNSPPMGRSSTLPYRSLKVGLLRQQRGLSPSSARGSMSSNAASLVAPPSTRQTSVSIDGSSSRGPHDPSQPNNSTPTAHQRKFSAPVSFLSQQHAKSDTNNK